MRNNELRIKNRPRRFTRNDAPFRLKPTVSLRSFMRRGKTCNLKPNLGFVLLFSLLVSSILLATGLGISRIMIRQISLASLSRESQIAFFAADSGLECALHWDVFGKFDLVTPPTPPNSQTIYCNRAIIKDGMPSEPPGIKEASASTCNSDEPPMNNIITGDTKSCFTFSLQDNQACAFVVVDKSVDNSDPTVTITKTKITSNGYNKCNLKSPNILQRTLEINLATRLDN